MAYDYLVRCSERRRVEGSLRSLVSYYVAYAKRTGLKPLGIETLKRKHQELYDIIKECSRTPLEAIKHSVDFRD